MVVLGPVVRFGLLTTFSAVVRQMLAFVLRVWRHCCLPSQCRRCRWVILRLVFQSVMLVRLPARQARERSEEVPHLNPRARQVRGSQVCNHALVLRYIVLLVGSLSLVPFDIHPLLWCDRNGRSVGCQRGQLDMSSL